MRGPSPGGTDPADPADDCPVPEPPLAGCTSLAGTDYGDDGVPGRSSSPLIRDRRAEQAVVAGVGGHRGAERDHERHVAVLVGVIEAGHHHELVRGPGALRSLADHTRACRPIGWSATGRRVLTVDPDAGVIRPFDVG